MKNFKKFLTLVLAVMMVVSSVAFSTSAATTKFEDVDAKNEALVEAVDLLSYMGVAKGTSETTFGADELVTRQQFALFIYRLMKGGKDAPSGAANTTKFTDLEDPTYNYAIAWANAQGIVNGKSETTFAPKDGIKLQEAYAMIVRALKWEEEEELTYPFDHIEIAEQDGVELDEDLDSSVGYGDVLTRGDMAILLYNAFFAEIGIEEVEYITSTDNNGHIDYLRPNTFRKLLCEEAFGVEIADYRAVATPNYYVTGYEPTYDLGFDAIYFEQIGNTNTAIKNAVYLTPEEIDVDAAKLNDYFLGVFTMYVVPESNSTEIDKVLFADCNMTKKTVNDIKLAEVSSNKRNVSYLTDAFGVETDAKALSGKLIADGEEIYAYNAPYTYVEPIYAYDYLPNATGMTTPDYNGDGTEDALDKSEYQYDMRNGDNVDTFQLVKHSNGDVDVFEWTEVTLLSTSAANVYEYDSSALAQATAPVGGYIPFEDEAKELISKLPLAYYGGLYEADLLDVDGDGRYEYINYKPYSVFVVDSDDDYDFDVDNTFAPVAPLNIPYVYTNGATVTGAEFADEDVVLGYFSNNLELVHVVEVLKPTTSTVANYKTATGTLILGNGDKVDFANQWKMVNNNLPGSGVNASGEILVADIVYDFDVQSETEIAGNAFFRPLEIDRNDKYDFYVYDGTVLCSTLANANTKYTENLIILSNDKPMKETFDAATGDVAYYVYAYVDGTAKYVMVEYNEDLDTDGPIDNGGTASYALDARYVGALSTYTENNGVYSIQPLGFDVYSDDDHAAGIVYGTTVPVYKAINGTLADLNTEDDIQYFANLTANSVTLDKVAGTRFNLVDSGANLLSYTDVVTGVTYNKSVELKSFTKIVVKNTDSTTGKITYNEFDATTFRSTNAVALTNVTAVVSNNANSKSKEDLVLLYGEAVDFDFTSTANRDGHRIVSGYEINEGENGEWRYYYDLYDPFTGTKVAGVPGKTSNAKANNLSAAVIGDLVELKDDMVDDDTPYVNVATVDIANLVWIADVDTEDDFFTVVPFNGTMNNVNDALVDHVESYTGVYNTIEGAPTAAVTNNIVGFDKDTAVSVVTLAGAYVDGAANEVDFWKSASIKASDMAALANPGKDLRAYNTKVPDSHGNYQTKHSPYVKAYVAIDESTISSLGYPTADYVIVVVNAGEEAAID